MVCCLMRRLLVPKDSDHYFLAIRPPIPTSWRKVVAINWNRWTVYFGMGGRFRLESVVGLDWNGWSFWVGIRTLTEASERIGVILFRAFFKDVGPADGDS